MERFRNLTRFVKERERHIAVGALVVGFIFDTLTLGRPDQLYGNIILITHFVISGGAIFLLALYERRGAHPPYLIPLMQFSFGNLASGLLVVYGQSGTFEGSILFFLVLGAFLFGNEFLRGYYAQLSFHLAAWYFLLLGYLAVVVPIVIGSVGDRGFVISGILSLFITVILLLAIKKISREKVILARRKNFILIGGIFLLFGGLYFYNVIPPVPLALTDIGIYHSISKTASGDYRATYEKAPWYEFYKKTSAVFTRVEGDSAYCFSSIFVPVRISTGVYHRWEEYDGGKDEWIERVVVSFPINGGRIEGYRGYSIKEDITPGTWRCSVELPSGGIIGRTTFVVSNAIANIKPALSTVEL